eukprot:TRINITY_DN11955_c0_g1_i1.p1 TRINITY_DN11955_c0_g1~~TRINITY_DN11955_c0_g1_i1.p1  ORF type:complete len:100 (+),score=23.19 TRINITY_DN11955_c0_g1_i1:50-349(+)
MYAEELLCRHCGFVFWVEETLSSHCQQFHQEEEKLLDEKEKNRLAEMAGEEMKVNRKRKRKGRKITSARVPKASDQCHPYDPKLIEENVMDGTEDDQKF